MPDCSLDWPRATVDKNRRATVPLIGVATKEWQQAMSNALGRMLKDVRGHDPVKGFAFVNGNAIIFDDVTNELVGPLHDVLEEALWAVRHGARPGGKATAQRAAWEAYDERGDESLPPPDPEELTRRFREGAA